MRNIGTLYRFELKKILHNKLTIAMLLLVCGLSIILGINPGDSESNAVRELQHSINGRAIDNTLLSEMYQVIDDYAIAWNESNTAYERVAYVEKEIIGSSEILRNYSADEMYEIRESDMFAMMNADHMTDDEIDWWAEKESQVKKPFVYEYMGGPFLLSMVLSTMCLLMIILSAMCLSTVFAGEHRQRTDQMVLSCVNGRKETYFAKIAAGATFLLCVFIISMILLAIVIYFRKGLDGMNTMVQLELPFSAYPLSIGKFIVIQIVIMIVATIFFAIVGMVFSEVFRNGLPVMGLMIGCYLAVTLFDIPSKFRVASQIAECAPTEILSVWSLYDHRLVKLGGHFFTNYQIAPIVYVLIAIVLYILGRKLYCSFQVSGR